MKEAHRTSKKRIVGYEWCARCGLVYLKNEATRRAIRLGCDYKDLEKEGKR